MKKLSILLQESTLARFLLPVGLIATIFGVAVLIISIQNSNYKEVEAKVTKVELEQEAYTDTDGNHQDETYTVYVSYTVDGTNYNSELSGLGKYKKGDKMTIYYNPKNPKQITQTKSLIVPIIIIVAGVVAFIVGIVDAKNTFAKYKKLKEQEKGWEHGK